MHNFQKIVVTWRPSTLGWHKSKSITGEISTEIAHLKAQEGPLIQVHGSCELIQLLFTHDLVDEMRLWTFPVVLGSGRRLFGNGTVPEKFKLVKIDSTSNGVVMGIYRAE